ncbi:MAG: TetR/AcrR family transcriptional regulator [Eubacteriales bacterium]|nr:TetR/AcrR family transcriptional regulator [Eubacteriales bacterium]
MPANFRPEERETIYRNLLKEGYRILASMGMKKLKISDVARAAGIATGSFYSFFSSKYDFIYQMILERKRESLSAFEALCQSYPQGIPFDALKQFWLDNLRTNNIYRLLSQSDYALIQERLDLPPEEDDKNQQLAEQIMSHLASDKGADDFMNFSEAYKLLVIGSSDLSKLDQKRLDLVLEHLVDTACRFLY